MPTASRKSGLLALAMLGCVTAQGFAADPKLPPGKPMGGIPVAIIGQGLDYTRPEIVQRLSRDGEGEAIAWDFADDDARPFSAEAKDGPIAAIVLAEGQAATLILARTASGDEAQIAAALRFLASTPARIALIVAEPGRPVARVDLASAARQLSGLLLVIPARHVSGRAENGEAGGLLVVGTGETMDPKSDVATNLDVRQASAVERAQAARTPPDDIAAARIAALAARLVAVSPDLAGVALKSKILSFAKPSRPGAVPVIPEIARIHWLE